MYACICNSVSDTQIRQAVEQGARSVGDLSSRLGVGGQCGRCLESIGLWLDGYLADVHLAAVGIVSPPTPVEVAKPPDSAGDAPRAAWFSLDV
jgi:bacterioferritin-associated ferredoxin